jgi:hypothetical protein
MRILLLGEYSGLHSSLRAGLRALGHHAIVASAGDGFKEIRGDICLGPSTSGAIGTIARVIHAALTLPRLTGFDVVQLVGPKPVPGFLFNAAFVYFLRFANKRLFLLASGDDSRYFDACRFQLAYNPMEESIKTDLADPAKYIWDKPRWRRWNESILRIVDGVIPTVYECQLAYRSHPKAYEIITLPFDLSGVESSGIAAQEPVTIFHGLNRPGFKGTTIVDAAMAEVSAKYGDRVRYLRVGNLPLNKYLSELRKADIVIDQVRSYSYGMNALFALAMGKVVISGAEPVALEAAGLTGSPVLNVKPNADDLGRCLHGLLGDRAELERRAAAARPWVAARHDARVIAERYVAAWSSGAANAAESPRQGVSQTVEPS